MSDSTKHYPLSIETVKKIKAQNKEGLKPDVLETVEIISGKPKEAEPEFVDVVGQISLKSLDKNSRKQKEQLNRRSKPTNTAGSSSSNTKQPSTDQRQQKQRLPKHKNKTPRGNNNRQRPPEKDA